MKGSILAQPLLLATVTLAAGCSEDQWEGYVHPDRMDQEVYDYRKPVEARSV